MIHNTYTFCFVFFSFAFSCNTIINVSEKHKIYRVYKQKHSLDKNREWVKKQSTSDNKRETFAVRWGREQEVQEQEKSVSKVTEENKIMKSAMMKLFLQLKTWEEGSARSGFRWWWREEAHKRRKARGEEQERIVSKRETWTKKEKENYGGGQRTKRNSKPLSYQNQTHPLSSLYLILTRTKRNSKPLSFTN